ncbi:SdpI family protein [Patescibacteria group bacterium]|nr:SdpI family protein [Patescibacteria group bacterium]
MKKSYIIILSIILLSFTIGLYFYPQFSDKVASHWNVRGDVDDYMGKFWGAFLMPIVSLAIFLMLIFIPKIDPLKANIAKFRKHFDGFIVLIVLFLFYLYLLSILWNLGARFNMGQVLAPALGVLFYYCGVLVGKAKRNWFIGIRTPWTLSSDTVWDKTHKLGAKLFKVAGAVALIGVVAPKISFFVLFSFIFAFVIYIVVYSYLEYQKEKK